MNTNNYTRTLRALGISQVDVATRMGCSRNYVSRIELGCTSAAAEERYRQAAAHLIRQADTGSIVTAIMQTLAEVVGNG